MHGPLKLVPGPTFGPALTDTEPTLTTVEPGLVGRGVGDGEGDPGLGDGDRGPGDGEVVGVEEEVGVDRGDGVAGETADGGSAPAAWAGRAIGVDGTARGVRSPSDRGAVAARSEPCTAGWCRCDA